MTTIVIHVDFGAPRKVQAQACRALLETAAGLRMQAAMCESASMLTGPRQLATVDSIATDVVASLIALDETVDALMQAAPRRPVGGKETA